MQTFCGMQVRPDRRPLGDLQKREGSELQNPDQSECYAAERVINIHGEAKAH